MDVKKISITGTALDYMGKKTRRRKQHGGDDDTVPAVANNTNIKIIKSNTLSNTPVLVNISEPVKPEPVKPEPVKQAPLMSVAEPIQNVQQGGVTKPKIIIAPKQKTRKVILAPKHQTRPHVNNPMKKIMKRTIRRVTLPVHAIKNKIAKTRRHIKESQTLPIDKIRKELIAAKLLNPNSKAPDALLRKIYADVKIIGNN